MKTLVLRTVIAVGSLLSLSLLEKMRVVGIDAPMWAKTAAQLAYFGLGLYLTHKVLGAILDNTFRKRK